MAGLTREGFIPLSYGEIKRSIERRLNDFSPGFDTSPQSPDGQMIGIMTAQLAMLWTELDKIYKSFDPNAASGQALRNLGAISGVLYGVGGRSTARVLFKGIAGTVVPQGTLVANAKGQQFFTTNEIIIPGTTDVNAVNPGATPVDQGSITQINATIGGLVSIEQPVKGVVGKPAQSEQQFRNKRNRTVMRNSVSSEETLRSRLIDIGMTHVQVINNNTDSSVDGISPRHIHVIVANLATVPDDSIARVIFNTISMGIPTFGSTSVVVNDVTNKPHTIKFSKATEQRVKIEVSVKFLDLSTAFGAIGIIKEALVDHVNSLDVGEDLVYSRLFSLITPTAKADVTVLKIGTGTTLGVVNVSPGDNKYLRTSDSDVTITKV